MGGCRGQAAARRGVSGATKCQQALGVFTQVAQEGNLP